jgi:putative DNA primase/helicase
MVIGCLDWQPHGLGNAESVDRATQAYKDEMDPLRDFFAECCIFDPGAWTATADLRATYDVWCRERGEKNPVPWNDIADALRRRACEPKVKEIAGKDTRGWRGAGLGTGAK